MGGASAEESNGRFTGVVAGDKRVIGSGVAPISREFRHAI